MRGLFCLVLVFAALYCRPVAANAIYRCAGSAGEVAFSDLPCPGGQVQTMQPTTTVDMAVSADERAMLDRLDRRAPSTETTHRSSNAATAARAASQDARRCAAAEAALDRIHAKKRSGYRASGAAALDARQRDAQARRDRECLR